MWARARIAELSRRLLHARASAPTRPTCASEIMALSLEHHLMTPYTAFVAVDASRVTAGGRGKEVAVPVEVPEAVRRPPDWRGLRLRRPRAGRHRLRWRRHASPARAPSARSKRAPAYRRISASGDGYGSAAQRLPHGSDRRAHAARRVTSIIPGAATVRGSLDKAIIRRIVRRHQNEIRYCYEKELQKDHKLEGRLVLEADLRRQRRVVASGIAESASTTRSTSAPASREPGGAGEFPKALGGGAVHVRYPYFSRRPTRHRSRR